MAGTKINIWIPLLLLAMAAGCTGRRPQKHTPVRLREAGYIYEWNDDGFYAKQQDILFDKWTPASFVRLIRQAKPQKASTIQWIFPGESQTEIIAFIYPSDTISADSTAILSYKGQNYYRLSLEGTSVFFYPSDTVWVWTSGQKSMEKYLRKGWRMLSPKDNEDINQNRNEEAFAFWYVSPQQIYHPAYRLTNNPFLEKHAGYRWIWDVESPGQSVFYGLGLTDPLKHNLTDVFDGIGPAGQALGKYLPAFGEFTSWYFQSFPVWSKQWEAYKKSSGYRQEPFPAARYKSLKSVAQTHEPEKALVLWFEEIPSEMTPGEALDVVNDIRIFPNPDSTAISSYFYPLTSKKNYPYMAFDGHKCVMAPDKNTLIRVMEKLSGTPPSHSLWKHISLEDTHLLWGGKTGYWAWQMNDHKVLQTMVFRTKPAGRSSSATSTGAFIFDFQWPAPITYGPQWIYHHRSRKYELLFQDQQGRLVLVDSKGKRRWQRDAGEPVLGPIHQVDMFRNGKRQFLYSTPSGVYVMDILGTLVSPFPIKKTLQVPAGLFDYDRNRHYRIAISSGKQVALYDIQGKKVKGFRFNSLTAPLQTAPQHIRIGNKDYILLHQTDGKLWILDRKGNIRIPVKDKIPAKAMPWTRYRRGFAIQQTDGKWVHIDRRGKKSFLFNGKTFGPSLSLPGHILSLDAQGNGWLDGREIRLRKASWQTGGARMLGRQPVFWLYDPHSRSTALIQNGKVSYIKGQLADISPDGHWLVLQTDNRRLTVRKR